MKKFILILWSLSSLLRVSLYGAFYNQVQQQEQYQFYGQPQYLQQQVGQQYQAANHVMQGQYHIMGAQQRQEYAMPQYPAQFQPQYGQQFNYCPQQNQQQIAYGQPECQQQCPAQFQPQYGQQFNYYPEQNQQQIAYGQPECQQQCPAQFQPQYGQQFNYYPEQNQQQIAYGQPECQQQQNFVPVQENSMKALKNQQSLIFSQKKLWYDMNKETAALSAKLRSLEAKVESLTNPRQIEIVNPVSQQVEKVQAQQSNVNCQQQIQAASIELAVVHEEVPVHEIIAAIENISVTDCAIVVEQSVEVSEKNETEKNKKTAEEKKIRAALYKEKCKKNREAEEQAKLLKDQKEAVVNSNSQLTVAKQDKSTLIVQSVAQEDGQTAQKNNIQVAQVNQDVVLVATIIGATNSLKKSSSSKKNKSKPIKMAVKIDEDFAYLNECVQKNEAEIAQLKERQNKSESLNAKNSQNNLYNPNHPDFEGLKNYREFDLIPKKVRDIFIENNGKPTALDFNALILSSLAMIFGLSESDNSIIEMNSDLIKLIYRLDSAFKSSEFCVNRNMSLNALHNDPEFIDKAALSCKAYYERFVIPHFSYLDKAVKTEFEYFYYRLFLSFIACSCVR